MRTAVAHTTAALSAVKTHGLHTTASYAPVHQPASQTTQSPSLPYPRPQTPSSACGCTDSGYKPSTALQTRQTTCSNSWHGWSRALRRTRAGASATRDVPAAPTTVGPRRLAARAAGASAVGGESRTATHHAKSQQGHRHIACTHTVNSVGLHAQIARHWLLQQQLIQ